MKTQIKLYILNKQIKDLKKEMEDINATVVIVVQGL
jgi:hypothetical protein